MTKGVVAKHLPVAPRLGSPSRGPVSSAAADDLAHRLALWLADVSAEGAAGPLAPRPSPTQLPAASSRVAERPR